MPYINSIGISQAPFCHAQSDILAFMLSMFPMSDADAEKVTRLYERSEINERYSAIEDFSLPKSEWLFFDKNIPTSVERRMKKFFEIAPALCKKAIENCISNEEDLKTITHLITVSCTGISAPGLDVQLLQLLNLENNIYRTSINFMGCYAAMHALKQANDICKANENAKVLIVDVELCTLHFQDNYTMDNIASSLLFADGAAAVLVSNQVGIYSIESFYSEVAFKGYGDMSWDISSSGFLMKLSTLIPTIIAENIKPMLFNSLSKMNLKQEDINHWAIHPGGKKIVNEIKKALLLSDEDVAMSRSILNNYGNMSSVTILFLLKRMQEQIYKSNENVYSVAFGPGLTIESMFLKSC